MQSAAQQLAVSERRNGQQGTERHHQVEGAAAQNRVNQESQTEVIPGKAKLPPRPRSVCRKKRDQQCREGNKHVRQQGHRHQDVNQEGRARFTVERLGEPKRRLQLGRGDIGVHDQVAHRIESSGERQGANRQLDDVQPRLTYQRACVAVVRHGLPPNFEECVSRAIFSGVLDLSTAFSEAQATAVRAQVRCSHAFNRAPPAPAPARCRPGCPAGLPARPTGAPGLR